ncbi:MAG: N-glycosylase/DNA lyase [Armatimonadetes bacterium]|nr:N-glycosylase/DNA lyase [Armatimonadota bacterium]
MLSEKQAQTTEAVARERRKLLALYEQWRRPIEARLAEFRRLGREGSEEDLFRELVFCLLTPQSKARSCWAAVETMEARGWLLGGDARRLARLLRGAARFHNNKARYIVRARQVFTDAGELAVRSRLEAFGDSAQGQRQARDWLAKEVQGLGLKEASHFLRNVGRGDHLAILDRHILRNLARLGVIEQVPASLTASRYHDIELRTERFAAEVAIPMAHLDLLLWCKETGEVFK